MVWSVRLPPRRTAPPGRFRKTRTRSIVGCVGEPAEAVVAGGTGPLRAPLEISFDYTRSLGPVIGRFLTGLRDRRIIGARAADGSVHVPPFEFDPVTHQAPEDFAEVGPEGTVLTWSWMPAPLTGQPLDRPFAWALIRLDGSATALLHAIDSVTPAAIRTGMRVRPRWATERVGSIRDILYFETCATQIAPDGDSCHTNLEGAVAEGAVAEGAVAEGAVAEGVAGIITPIRLRYEHTAAPGEAIYLRGLAGGKLLGQRCPACRKVYIPARGTCPTDGVPMAETVELPETGTVTTFCVVNVPYPGQQLQPPYVAAAVLLDGADIAFQQLILGCEPDEVRMGMRVRAVWRDRTIGHFEPAGEPDAPYESYARHL